MRDKQDKRQVKNEKNRRKKIREILDVRANGGKGEESHVEDHCFHDHIHENSRYLLNVVDVVTGGHWPNGSPPPRTESFGDTVQIGERERVDAGTDANLPLPAATEDGS